MPEAVYKIKTITFPKSMLHSSYERGKDIRETDAFWKCGLNWTVDSSGKEWDVLDMYVMLDLYRKKDNFLIAKLHLTATYEVAKAITFAQKYDLIIELSNNAASQIQGAWRVKFSNPFVCKILPQAFNKVMELETGIKEMIYENWE